MSKTRRTQLGNRFINLVPLGDGGQGAVYKAYDTKMTRTVALKFLHEHELDQPGVRTRFLHEARLTAQLQHDHIVRALEYGEIHETPFIAFEYIAGETLADKLQRERTLPAETLIRYLIPIAKALGYAHALKVVDASGHPHHGIYHRDVTPSNILIREADDRPFLIDFGIGMASFLTVSVTRQNTGMGNPPYMSPEQVRAQPIDGRSDVYNLGVTLYEGLVGHTPFVHGNTIILLEAIKQEPPPPLRLPPGTEVPDALAEVVQACLAKDPNDRPGTGYALAKQLHQALESPTPVPPTKHPARWPIAVVLSVLLAAGIWWGAQAGWFASPPGDVTEATPMQAERPADTLATHIARLLREGEDLLRRDALTRPAGNAAYDRVQAVLALDPSNADALTLRRRIGDRYEALGLEQADAQDWAEAYAYFDMGLNVDPTHPTLADSRTQVRQAEQGAERRAQPTQPEPRAPTTRQPGSTATNTLGMTFAYIPPGSFLRGSENGDDDEKPVRRITISEGFELQTTEVTQAQWEAVMGTNPSSYKGDNRPVERVSWEDAQAFIQRLNARNEGYTYRLPTEAEWEYAARAGTTTRYSWGNEAPVCQPGARNGARFDDNDVCDDIGTAPVGMYQPNDWGLYDMHGNVWEWVQDWYGSSYHSNSPSTDPRDLESGTDRVLRGGSWSDIPSRLRAANRHGNAPAGRSYFYGFRVARTR